MRAATIPWLPLLLLGAAHGLNPAMGWLFAVGRGLQRRDRRALWRALGPLAAGHALAIAGALGCGARRTMPPMCSEPVSTGLNGSLTSYCRSSPVPQHDT